MKGNPKVLAGLQAALNLETRLSLQYMLDARLVKRSGLSIAGVLATLHEQCETYARKLAAKILFLEGEPQIWVAEAAITRASVSDILIGALAAEQALVELYVQVIRDAFDAGDMATFHFLQHIAKWHQQGGGYKGHIAWLEKQTWQLKEFGENAYEQTKA